MSAVDNNVIEILAASEAELRARARDLEGERDVYRFWFQQTLHALYAAQKQEHQWGMYERERLLAENRELRAIVVAEMFTDDALAILDHEPACSGHSVVQ